MGMPSSRVGLRLLVLTLALALLSVTAIRPAAAGRTQYLPTRLTVCTPGVPKAPPGYVFRPLGSCGPITPGIPTHTFWRAFITANTLQTEGNKCVDVPSGRSVNGARLQLWTCNGNIPAQSFSNARAGTTADGFPIITLATVRGDGDGLYKLTGKCVDIPSGNAVRGAAIQLFNCNGNDAQRFKYVTGRGFIGAINNSRACWDVPSGRFVNGAKLRLWDCNGGAAQVFR